MKLLKRKWQSLPAQITKMVMAGEKFNPPRRTVIAIHGKTFLAVMKCQQKPTSARRFKDA